MLLTGHNWLECRLNSTSREVNTALVATRINDWAHVNVLVAQLHIHIFRLIELVKVSKCPPLVKVPLCVTNELVSQVLVKYLSGLAQVFVLLVLLLQALLWVEHRAVKLVIFRLHDGDETVVWID